MESRKALQLDADIAEFVCHDADFRQAVESIDTGIRKKLFSVLFRKNRNLSFPIEKTLADIMMFPNLAAGIRSRLLLFFLRSRVTKCDAKKEPFSDDERREKFRAKGFYDAGDYANAVKIGLQLLRHNEALQTDPSVVGFVMHCYNKMQDHENALVYACMNLSLEKHVPSANIGVHAAYLLGRYGDVVDIAFLSKEYLKHNHIYELALRAIFFSKKYEYLIELVNLIIEGQLSHKLTDSLIRTALDTAFRMGHYAEVIKFGGLVDYEHCSLSTFNMIAHAARNSGCHSLCSRYRKLYERKLKEMGCKIFEVTDQSSGPCDLEILPRGEVHWLSHGKSEKNCGDSARYRSGESQY